MPLGRRSSIEQHDLLDQIDSYNVKSWNPTSSGEEALVELDDFDTDDWKHASPSWLPLASVVHSTAQGMFDRSRHLAFGHDESASSAPTLTFSNTTQEDGRSTGSSLFYEAKDMRTLSVRDIHSVRQLSSGTSVDPVHGTRPASLDDRTVPGDSMRSQRAGHEDVHPSPMTSDGDELSDVMYVDDALFSRSNNSAINIPHWLDDFYVPGDRTRAVLKVATTRPKDANSTLLECSHSGCDSTFRTNQELQHHSRCHIPRYLRPHPCEHCDQRFLYPKDLKRHLLTHKSEARYYYCQVPSCLYFKRGFSRLDNLLRHKARRHAANSPVEGTLESSPVEVLDLAGHKVTGIDNCPDFTGRTALQSVPVTPQPERSAGTASQPSIRNFNTIESAGLACIDGQDSNNASDHGAHPAEKHPLSHLFKFLTATPSNDAESMHDGCDSLPGLCHMRARTTEDLPQNYDRKQTVPRIGGLVNTANNENNDSEVNQSNANETSQSKKQGKGANKDGRSNKRRRTSDGKKDDGEGADRPPQGTQTPENAQQGHRLACPVLKFDFTACSHRRTGYTDISYVKQHLRRHHLCLPEGFREAKAKVEAYTPFHFRLEVRSNTTYGQVERDLQRVSKESAVIKWQTMFSSIYPDIAEIPDERFDGSDPLSLPEQVTALDSRIAGLSNVINALSNENTDAWNWGISLQRLLLEAQAQGYIIPQVAPPPMSLLSQQHNIAMSNVQRSSPDDPALRGPGNSFRPTPSTPIQHPLQEVSAGYAPQVWTSASETYRMTSLGQTPSSGPSSSGQVLSSPLSQYNSTVQTGNGLGEGERNPLPHPTPAHLIADPPYHTNAPQPHVPSWVLQQPGSFDQQYTMMTPNFGLAELPTSSSISPILQNASLGDECPIDPQMDGQHSESFWTS